MEINYEKLKKEAPEMGIKMIILFGSQVSGKIKKESDYDVAVLTAPEKNISKGLDNYNDILFFLSAALEIPDHKLDLTDLNKENPFLRFEIFSQSRLIFGNESEYSRLAALAMREYIATASLRNLRERLIAKRHELLRNKIYG